MITRDLTQLYPSDQWVSHYRAQESSGRKWEVQTSTRAAGLRLLSFEQPACRSGPWLASGRLDLEKVLADKSPSRCPTHLVQTVCLRRCPLSFSSESLEFWNMPGRMRLTHQPQFHP